MPAENVLEVHHLKKSVGQGAHELSILTGVNLIVKPAQTLALIGESGSGKSTLLAILAGLDDGSSGEVKLLGHPLTNMDEEARARLRAQHIGFVFQSFMLIPTLNEQLELNPIQFSRLSPTLTESGKEELDTVSQFLQDNPEAIIVIEGHTSHPQDSWDWLAQARADSAKDYLVAQGIEESRIETVGFGNDQPLEGLEVRDARNRRIEITVNE